tara:strand:+ start:758 stop:1132 length:375 start_codon:yes stop_codon:yes gene_type:complete
MLGTLLVSILITLSSGFIVGIGNPNKVCFYVREEWSSSHVLSKVNMNEVTVNFKSETYAEYMARRTGSNIESEEIVKPKEEINEPTYEDYMMNRKLVEDSKRFSPSVLQKIDQLPHTRGDEGDN